MKAMLLAAGRGQRLRPLTDTVPKPMLMVRGRPLIDHQLEWLATAGITQVIVNLHHLGEVIADHLASSAPPVPVVFSREQTLLETGGGITKALPLLGDEPFAVLNGDIFTNFDFTRLPDTPAADDLMHLVVTPRPAFRAHGDFDCANGRVLARGEGFVYCGISVIRPELFAGRAVEPFSLAELMFSATDAGRLSAQVHTGSWTDIGTLEQYQALL